MRWQGDIRQRLPSPEGLPFSFEIVVCWNSCPGSRQRLFQRLLVQAQSVYAGRWLHRVFVAVRLVIRESLETTNADSTLSILATSQRNDYESQVLNEAEA